MKKIEALTGILQDLQLLVGILAEQSTDERVFLLQSDIESNLEVLEG